MASSTPSSILIFGATGQIGVHITESILAATPPFGKVTIFTSPSTANSKSDLLSKWKEKGVHVITGDVTSASDVAAAYKGVDTVISAVGRNVLTAQLNLIRIAEASGSVKWFFPSEFGTDVEHGEKSKGEKTHQVKLQVRRVVREEVRRMKVTYLVTGPFFEMWARHNYDFKAKKASVIDDGEGRVGFCTMGDVGKFTVAALRHPEVSFDKALKVQSFVVTPNQVLAEYERQTGGKKWTVKSTPLEEIKRIEEQKWKENDPAATGWTLRRIWAEGGTLYDKNDNELLGLGEGELESLEVAVKTDLGLGK